MMFTGGQTISGVGGYTLHINDQNYVAECQKGLDTSKAVGMACVSSFANLSACQRTATQVAQPRENALLGLNPSCRCQGLQQCWPEQANKFKNGAEVRAGGVRPGQRGQIPVILLPSMDIKGFEGLTEADLLFRMASFKKQVT